MQTKITTTTAEIIKAYFEGGNAKDKGSENIKKILQEIKDFVEGNEES